MNSVVNVAVGGWYPRGQARLRATLIRRGYEGAFDFWLNEYPPGSPSHQQSNYSFKTYALTEAARRGRDVLLWVDASGFAVGDVRPVFDEVVADGYFTIDIGPDKQVQGRWCSDKALAIFGYTRDQAMAMKQVSGMCVGVDLRTAVGREILGRWHRFSQTPGCFHGPWSNERGQASPDPRCLGHRHDQAALSIIVHELSLKVHEPTATSMVTMLDYDAESDAVRLAFAGM